MAPLSWPFSDRRSLFTGQRPVWCLTITYIYYIQWGRICLNSRKISWVDIFFKLNFFSSFRKCGPCVFCWRCNLHLDKKFDWWQQRGELLDCRSLLQNSKTLQKAKMTSTAQYYRKKHYLTSVPTKERAKYCQKFNGLVEDRRQRKLRN